MNNKFAVIDVETPNGKNDRICSIGITLIENYQIVDTKYKLINPECDFDEINTKIHGISSDCVKDAVTFCDAWKDISFCFKDYIIVAHNASFDLNVIRKALNYYNLIINTFLYIDTVEMSRDAFPNLANYRLHTVCDFLNIELLHHNSQSDSFATACILLNIIKAGFDTDRYIHSMNFEEKNSNQSYYHYSSKRSSLIQSLRELEKILKSISKDRIITKLEFDFLNDWLENHYELSGNFPFDSIFKYVKIILSDGIVEDNELVALLEICDKILNPVENSNNKCECINVGGKNIVLSGEFSFGSKSQVSDLLVSKGAIMQNTVSKKTDIVLVGNKGNDAWIAGNYGTKIKKAMELQNAGANILIIKESDFFQKNEVV